MYYMIPVGVFDPRLDSNPSVIDVSIGYNIEMVFQLLQKCVSGIDPGIREQPAVTMDPDSVMGKEHTHKTVDLIATTAGLISVCHVDRGFCAVMPVSNIKT